MCDITFSCVSDPKAARDVGGNVTFISLTAPLLFCSFVFVFIFIKNSSDKLVNVSLSVTCLFLTFLQLVLGPSGVLQGIRPGKCYVEMSTVDPETITELSQVRVCVKAYSS